MDDRRHIDNFVGARVGNQLHDGWGFIPILLVIAIGAAVIRTIQGRKPV